MESDPPNRQVSTIHRPVGIYLHIPFCEKKCFYCDFYSLENHSQRDEFLRSITREIELFGESRPGLKADTIFFGGGTPSLLTPTELQSILDALHKTFDISDAAEFTMECNPGAVDTAYLSEYRSLGVNRLSFGAQSFFDDELRFLSRIHSAREAVEAVSRARTAGFDNINIDLIYALPGQRPERLLANLRQAVSLGTEHISAYSLIVEPGTPLYSAVAGGEVVPSDDSTQASMYEMVMEFMEEHGYSHYEISNYAKPGSECRHNLKYWNSEEYVSFGPSAHSYLDGERWWNVSSLASYIAGLNEDILPVSAREKLTPQQLLDEFVLLHLRQGFVNTSDLLHNFSVSLEPEFVSAMEKAGYCEVSGDMLKLTRKGFTVSDEIARTLLGKHSHPA